jgi:hypothetical protein
VEKRDSKLAMQGTNLESLRRVMLQRARERTAVETYVAAHTAYVGARAAAKKYRGYRRVVKVLGSANTAGT